jgi:hypothetical protein
MVTLDLVSLFASVDMTAQFALLRGLRGICLSFFHFLNS